MNGYVLVVVVVVEMREGFFLLMGCYECFCVGPALPFWWGRQDVSELGDVGVARRILVVEVDFWIRL